MSKKYDVIISCPNCNQKLNITLYRSVWAETPGNRDMIFSDSINILKCPYCNYYQKLNNAFMYVDINRNFAVWWEPTPDLKIEEEMIHYAKAFGEGNFYATAPRVVNWDEFKETILKFERGELRGNPITNMDVKALKNAYLDQRIETKNKGCISTLLIFAFINFLLFLFIIKI